MKRAKIHITTLFIILLFQGQLVLAQDSLLLDKIHKIEGDLKAALPEAKADMFLELSESYWRIQPEKAINYGQKAIQLYKQLNDKKIANAYINTAIGFYYIGSLDSCIYYTQQLFHLEGISITKQQLGSSNNLLCVAFRRKGQYAVALKYGKESLKCFELCNDSSRIPNALDNISTIYRATGNYKMSLEFSLKSLKIFETQKDTINIAGTHFNIANTYADLKDYKNAKLHLSITAELVKEIDDQFFLADVYNNLGTIYQSTEVFETAMFYFQKALKLYQDVGDKNGIAFAMQNIGAVQISLLNYCIGISYLRSALHGFHQTKSIVDITDVYMDLGNAYFKYGKLDSALFFLNLANINNEKLNNTYLQLETIDVLQKVYVAKNDYKHAYVYRQQYILLRDSLQSKDLKLQLAKLEMGHNIVNKEKEVALWKKQQKVEASHNRLLIITVIFMTLFILLASVMVWQRRKKEQLINRLQYEKNQGVKSEMEERMRNQSKQLTTHALNMLQKNTLLQSLQEDIDRIGMKAKKEVKPELRSLNHKIKMHIKGEKDWDLFKMYFEQINKDFFVALSEISSELTSNDLRLLALIKLNMNIKEVASVLNLSPDSVKNARYRLRKKLNLAPKDDLFEFVNGLIS